MIAHINVNWLSPVKVRTTLIGGEKKMLVWNDLEADEKIKVYDKGVAYPSAIRADFTTCWSAIAQATCGRRRSNRSKRCAPRRLTSSMHREQQESFQRRRTPVCAWFGCWKRPTSRCESAARR